MKTKILFFLLGFLSTLALAPSASGGTPIRNLELEGEADASTNSMIFRGWVDLPTTNRIVATTVDTNGFWDDADELPFRGVYVWNGSDRYTNSLANGEKWQVSGWEQVNQSGEFRAGWSRLGYMADGGAELQVYISAQGIDLGGGMWDPPADPPGYISPVGGGSKGPPGASWAVAIEAEPSLLSLEVSYEWAAAIEAAIEGKLSLTGGVVSGTLTAYQFKVPHGTSIMNLAIVTNLYTGAIYNKAGTTRILDPEGGSGNFTGSITASSFRATSPRLASFYRASALDLSVGTSYVKIEPWSLSVGNGLTYSASAGTITITPGYWRVGGQFSFSGTINETFEIVTYIGEGEHNRIECQRKLGTGGDVGSASFEGMIYTTTNAVLSVRVKALSAGSTFSLHFGSFSVEGL